MPLSAGFESYLQLFTLGLHQAKENAAQGIRAFLFENRLNNERPIADVIGRFCIQRIFLWSVDLAGICSFILHDKIPFHKDSNERGKTDGCWHSSTGISPRPMLMGTAHNALWAFNARVSLTLSVCHRPQAATLALRPGVVRSLRKEVMAHRPYGSAQTGMYPFALYCGVGLPTGFLCQGASSVHEREKQGKGKLFPLSDRACQLMLTME